MAILATSHDITNGRKTRADSVVQQGFVVPVCCTTAAYCGGLVEVLDLAVSATSGVSPTKDFEAHELSRQPNDRELCRRSKDRDWQMQDAS